MKEIIISKEEYELLLELHNSRQDKREAYRLNIIILLIKGYTHKEIADALLIDERTVRRYKETYQKHGCDGLLEENYKGSNSYLSIEQLDELKTHLQKTIYNSSKEIAHYIKITYKIQYTPEGLIPLLHRLGFVYKKTKQQPGKGDPDKQLQFVKKYRKIVQKCKENDEIFFADATHPVHNSVPGYAWIEKGKEASIASNTGRERLNINGAVNPYTGKIVASDYPTVNAEATIDLLLKIRKQKGDQGRIIVFLDNARYNYSRAVRRMAKKNKIQLEYLPAYSPNLNLIERLWRVMKKEMMHNKYYATFAEFRQAMFSFLRNKSDNFRAMLKTLLADNFHIVETG